MSDYVAILDLETIPDRLVWTPPEPEAEPPLTPEQLAACEKCGQAMTDEENDRRDRKCPKMQRGKCRRPTVKESAARDPFPPKWAHQVCVFGVLVMNNQTGMPEGPPGSATATVPQEEAELLRAFAGFMQANNPPLVTWNGRGFDIPVLTLRSLRHGIAQPWYDSARAGRFGENGDIDLADVLSHYRYGDTKGEFSLDSMAKLIGLPGKGEIDGSQVAEIVRAGGIGTVQDYCLRDVVQTAYLWLRYKLLRGQLTLEQYRAAAQALEATWRPLPSFAGDHWRMGDFTRVNLEA